MRQNYKKNRLSPWLYAIFLLIAIGAMIYLHNIGGCENN